MWCLTVGWVLSDFSKDRISFICRTRHSKKSSHATITFGLFILQTSVSPHLTIHHNTTYTLLICSSITYLITPCILFYFMCIVLLHVYCFTSCVLFYFMCVVLLHVYCFTSCVLFYSMCTVLLHVYCFTSSVLFYFMCIVLLHVYCFTMCVLLSYIL